MYVKIQIKLYLGDSLTNNLHYELYDDTTSSPRSLNCPIPFWGIELLE